MSKREHEPTQPGNPYQLTINQHIHSKFCIKRFANEDGVVGVLERGKIKPSPPTGPGAQIFCAKRVWNEHLEHGALLSGIEKAFVTEIETCVATNVVTSHLAVTEYFVMWQIRARFDESPPPDLVLNGISGSGLTKDQEERLEKRGIGFVRAGGVVPGRNSSSILAVRDYDMAMLHCRDWSWGLISCAGSRRFICPDRPVSAWMPITRELGLAARLTNARVDDETVEQWNREAYGSCARLVFGHPEDIELFTGQLRGEARR